ncbi:putative hemolysin [Limimaricola variabilis]|jgi:putative hemolysin|uniref:Hemolysin n=1 Tax=Limimaricola variabilis TaxID=1492771 RepID=A0ABR6HQY5_9RHOB|nr:lysophospholipid acyltransferase family protein [Limimaricola variabilis]MBB3712966.1 putative hemolysin [Limimaricola variabilis]
MKDRIDPLIAERAPWMFRRSPLIRPLRGLLHLALSYDRTVSIGTRLQDEPTPRIMGEMGDMLARHLTVNGLDNIPRHGPALIVANHPTGIADGIMLYHVLKTIRPDLFIYANGDILRVLPQMADLIVPVEWRKEKRSHAKTKVTMDLTRQAVEDGRLGVIFPSGRLAKRRGLRLHERPWMASAAMLARKYDLPVIPVNIRARNSALFYLFDLIHPTLRDITLFHEMLNKDRQPYVVTVGEEISPAALPAKSEEGIEMLRKATLALGGRDAPTVSLVRATRPLLRTRA